MLDIADTAMNITKKELFDMIIDLRARLDALTGIPRGEISMTEARLAHLRGDRVTVELYERQFTGRMQAQAQGRLPVTTD